jgi:hypothetical protein
LTNMDKSDILLEEAAKRFEKELGSLEDSEQIEVLRGVIGVLNYAAAKWYLRAQTYKMLHGATFLMGFLLAWFLCE